MFLAGKLPSWNPFTEFGEPVVALGFTGAFYPGQFFMLAVGDVVLGYNILVVVHIAISGCLMYWCARVLGLGKTPSIISGAAWALGPQMISITLTPNMFFGSAWLPGVVAAFVRVIKLNTETTGINIVRIFLRYSMPPVFLALIMLAGGFQVALLAIIICIVLGIVLVFSKEDCSEEQPQNLKNGKFLRAVTSISVMVFAGILLAAVQVLPTLELFRQSIRSAGFEAYGMNYGSRYAFSWIRLLEVFCPSVFGPVIPDGSYGLRLLDPESKEPLWFLSTIYLGIGVILLSLFAVIKSRSKLMIALAGFGVIGVLAGLGENLPPISWLISHTPFLKSFRYAEKWYLLTAFAMPIMAGIGMQVLQNSRNDSSNSSRAKTIFLATTVILLVSVLLLLFCATGIINNIWILRISKSLTHVTGVIALLSFLILRYKDQAFKSDIITWLLCGVIIADLAIAARYQTFTMPREKFNYAPQIPDRIVQQNNEKPDGWTLILAHKPETSPPIEIEGKMLGKGEQFQWIANHQMVAAAPLVSKTPTLQRNLILATVPVAKILEHIGKKFKELKELLNELKEKHSLNNTSQETSAAKQDKDLLCNIRRNREELSRLLNRYGIKYLLDKSPPPEKPAVPGTKLVADWPETGQSLWINPHARPLAYLATERSNVAEIWSGNNSSVEVLESDYTSIKYQVKSSQDTILVENALNYPGWYATVDGQSVPVKTINGLCRLIPIPAGDHTVILTFKSQSLNIGLIVSIICWAVITFLVVTSLFVLRFKPAGLTKP